MKVGDKFVAVNRPYTTLIVTTFSEHNAKFRILEIIEERNDAKEEWTGKVGTGYLAKDINTGEIYGFNYPIINGGFSDTPFLRYIPNDETDNFFNSMTDEEKKNFFETDYILYNIANIQCPAEAEFCKKLDFVSFCEEHQKHYYTDNGCMSCQFNLKNKVIIPDEDKPKFKSWY